MTWAVIMATGSTLQALAAILAVAVTSILINRLNNGTHKGFLLPSGVAIAPRSPTMSLTQLIGPLVGTTDAPYAKEERFTHQNLPGLPAAFHLARSLEK